MRKLVVLGLSLSSSWGNGHATTYRALLRAAAALGHDIVFFERDVAWYAANRDLFDPPYCRHVLYDSLASLERHAAEIANADAVIVGSYVPDGIAVGDFVLDVASGARLFYDIDTPVTLAALSNETCTYLSRRQIGRYDTYLSFTGGPALHRLEADYGAARARALYCSVDPDAYRPLDVPHRWDLGFLGTYSPDRRPALEELLVEPARRAPAARFVVVGAQYPDDIDWPANVERVEHLPPGRHAWLYSSCRWTLNLTRAAMVETGFSPSVRLFEAGACAAPIISDLWPGLDSVLLPGVEIVTAVDAQEVLAAVSMADGERARIAAAARHRVLREHSAARRARQLSAFVEEAIAGAGGRNAPPSGAEFSGPSRKELTCHEQSWKFQSIDGPSSRIDRSSSGDR